MVDKRVQRPDLIPPQMNLAPREQAQQDARRREVIVEDALFEDDIRDSHLLWTKLIGDCHQ